MHEVPERLLLEVHGSVEDAEFLLLARAGRVTAGPGFLPDVQGALHRRPTPQIPQEQASIILIQM